MCIRDRIWFAFVNGLGFRYSAQKVDDLRLPGAPIPVLRDVIELNDSPNGKPMGEEASP